MIAHLRGTVHKLSPGEVTVDVQGVGYLVLVPLDVWGALEGGTEHTLCVSTYVREDRFDLFGFLDRTGRMLFEELITKPGIGPRLGLELCAVSRDLLHQAIEQQDPKLLMSVKGIGKKTAEKLLLDLQSLREKHPEMFGTGSAGTKARGDIDKDAIAALSSLGYQMPTILEILRGLPDDLETTEERVTAALRSL